MVASLAVGGGMYAIHPDPWPAAAAFCVGTFVDLDHILDLWMYQKHRRENEKLMDVFDEHTWVKSYVLFHALELIPILLALAIFSEDSWIWAGVFCGYTTHLVMDIIGNRSFPLTYFLLYRISKRFDARYIWWDSHPPGTAWDGKRRTPPADTRT